MSDCLRCGASMDVDPDLFGGDRAPKGCGAVYETDWDYIGEDYDRVAWIVGLREDQDE